MKILTIDDHVLFREGLCHVLRALDEQVLILESSTYSSALQLILAHADLDFVLLDLQMPEISGFQILTDLTGLYPALPIVILSGSNIRSDIQKAFELGAVGYIGKDTTGAVMLNALRLILSGGIYVPPIMMQQQKQILADQNGEKLTPRQLQVLSMLAHGSSNKCIAAQLNLSEATIKMHVTAIMKNLGVSNRTQASIKYSEMYASTVF